MPEDLGRTVAYWQCRCYWRGEVDVAAVGRGSWDMPMADGGVEHIEGEACPRCGGRLERKTRVEYPKVTTPEELVVDGVYYVDHDYHNHAPLNGVRFRVVRGPFLPRGWVGGRVIRAEPLDPSYPSGADRAISLYSLGIVDPPRSLGRNIHNTTYRVS